MSDDPSHLAMAEERISRLQRVIIERDAYISKLEKKLELPESLRDPKAALESERDRLREALQKIESHKCGPFQAADIARTAVAPKGSDDRGEKP
jgi:hypothetical protein